MIRRHIVPPSATRVLRNATRSSFRRSPSCRRKRSTKSGDAPSESSPQHRRDSLGGPLVSHFPSASDVAANHKTRQRIRLRQQAALEGGLK